MRRSVSSIQVSSKLVVAPVWLSVFRPSNLVAVRDLRPPLCRGQPSSIWLVACGEYGAFVVRRHHEMEDFATNSLSRDASTPFGGFQGRSVSKSRVHM